MGIYRRPVWAEIDLAAIGRNVRAMKALVSPGVALMAVVKADGYGHGAVPAARAALEAGADRLGVALLEEAAELRAAGVTAPLLVLSEMPASAAAQAVELGLTATVCSSSAALALSDAAAAAGDTVLVHIKIDTGMNRLGVRPVDAPALADEIAGLPGLSLEGVFSHFACADQPGDPSVTEQAARFEKATRTLSAGGHRRLIRHAANSAATLLFPQTQYDMVRLGITIYGLYPGDATRDKVRLEPAMSLKAQLSHVKPVPAGEGISYGHIYRTADDTVIGTVPAGYADGYTRLLSGKAEALVGGSRVPVVGRICMDQFMIDLGAGSGCHPGDEVVLIGRQGNEEITADELAAWLGTINYEIVCMVSKRVPRVYSGS